MIKDFVVEQSNVITAKLNKGFKDKTPVRTGRAQAGWLIDNVIVKAGDTALITNKVPYIGYLNYGTPYNDGHFMVERTIQEVQIQYK